MEDQTTVLVTANFDASVNSAGHIVLEPEEQTMSKLADIHMQVMWNRLISVVEEQAQTLVRTAFGAATREAGDLSAGVFFARWPHGRAGGDRHAGPRELDGGVGRHFLNEYPAATMAPATCS